MKDSLDWTRKLLVRTRTLALKICAARARRYRVIGYGAAQ